MRTLSNLALGYDMAWQFLGLPLMRIKQPDVLVAGQIVGEYPFCPDNKVRGVCGAMPKCTTCCFFPYEDN